MIKFPWTKRIEKLEKLVSENQEYVNTLGSNYHDIFESQISRIIALEEKFDALNKELEEANQSIQRLLNSAESLEKRLGQVETMHAATSKEQNRLFGEAMSQMIEMSGKVSIHIANLAEKRIDKIAKRDILITINGKVEVIEPRELSYDEIITLAYGFIPDGNISIFYKNGGDSEKPSGTMFEDELLVVKSGTSINTTVVNEN